MSFKFYGYVQVYLHCQIFMCHKQSSDSRCSSGCQGNNIKRVRRSVTLESEETGVRLLRRRDSEEEEVKDYPPSKTYSLNIGPFVKSKDTTTGKWFDNQRKVQIEILPLSFLVANKDRRISWEGKTKLKEIFSSRLSHFSYL